MRAKVVYYFVDPDMGIEIFFEKNCEQQNKGYLIFKHRFGASVEEPLWLGKALLTIALSCLDYRFLLICLVTHKDCSWCVLDACGNCSARGMNKLRRSFPEGTGIVRDYDFSLWNPFQNRFPEWCSTEPIFHYQEIWNI